MYKSVNILGRQRDCKVCFMRGMKSGKRWPLSSSMELEATFIAKIFALSDTDEITSGPFMLEGTGNIPLLRILFEIFQNLWKVFLFNFAYA